MPEIEVQVIRTAYKKVYQCDDCEGGRMYSIGLATASLPPQYEHKCDRCKSHKFLNKAYYELDRGDFEIAQKTKEKNSEQR